MRKKGKTEKQMRMTFIWISFGSAGHSRVDSGGGRGGLVGQGRRSGRVTLQHVYHSVLFSIYMKHFYVGVFFVAYSLKNV